MSRFECSKKRGAACLRAACNFVLNKTTAGFQAEIRLENTASIRVSSNAASLFLDAKADFCY